MASSGFDELHNVLGCSEPCLLHEYSYNGFKEPYDPTDTQRPTIPTLSFKPGAYSAKDPFCFSTDDMRIELSEQAKFHRKKGKNIMDPSSVSLCDDTSAQDVRFFVLCLPYFNPEQRTWEEQRQSSSKFRYMSTDDPDDIELQIPSTRSLPDGVLSCRPAIISCTVISPSSHPVDVLCTLLTRGWGSAELDSSFCTLFPFLREQIEDVRVGFERTVIPDLVVEPAMRWGSFFAYQRTDWMSYLMRQLATKFIVRKLTRGPIAISRLQGIDVGRLPEPKLGAPASLVTNASLPSFVTARSNLTGSAAMSPNRFSPFNMIEIIRENELPVSGLPAALVKIHNDYYTTLHQQRLIQPHVKELDWSGKGQHVTFATQDTIPLSYVCHLGSGLSATVDKVICRRIALARKTMTCSKQWTVTDALREVSHLQNLRHVHIVQLVGTYLQNRSFSILMYPVADSHLGTFLQETLDMQDKCRKDFLASALGCLASAVAFIHERTTKHMDIKPQNILVRSDGSWWRIYITDFGFSRSFDPQDHSQTDGPTALTRGYCSPEVFNFDSRGRAADVFSLGCVFLEITCVTANIDLDDFADARRGDGGDKSFHANLDRVVQWALTSLRSSLLCLQDSKREARACEKVIELQMKMISREPSMRPTASEVRSRLASFPQCAFSPTTCCTSPPEPYEVYEQK
ncbi:hypothetical protein AA0114_g11391 [Alternaria tenuissima]|uniref:Protein kinase domain-containing protein n=1 Tax=Alternaria tenuissima TaxID=119927 RepID=A0A4Q4M1R0_9PLEO|nr:hypothetical protein AA0114_g11391 [Alternaria tenuissima]